MTNTSERAFREAWKQADALELDSKIAEQRKLNRRRYLKQRYLYRPLMIGGPLILVYLTFCG